MARWPFCLPALLLLCARVAAGAPPAAVESPLRQVALLALAAAEQQAVLRLPDGNLVLVKPGDAVPGTEATVVEIQAGRLILEERLPRAVRAVWMEPAAASGGAGPIRFFDPRPPARKPLLRPSLKPLQPTKQEPAAGRGPGG